MHFIKLTMAKGTGRAATVINMELVSEILPASHGSTVLFACCTSEGEQAFTDVEQTPEEILAMI